MKAMKPVMMAINPTLMRVQTSVFRLAAATEFDVLISSTGKRVTRNAMMGIESILTPV